jgi:hypothetical protein
MHVWHCRRSHLAESLKMLMKVDKRANSTKHADATFLLFICPKLMVCGLALGNCSNLSGACKLPESMTSESGAHMHYTYCAGRVGESEVLFQHLHRIYHNPVKRQAVIGQLKEDDNDLRRINMLMELCHFSCGKLKPGPPPITPPSKHMLSQQSAQPSPLLIVGKALWAR